MLRHLILFLHLLKVHCLPILRYGLEACNLSRAQLSSIDFVVVRCCMKIFRTPSRQIVLDCLNRFGLSLPSDIIAYRSRKFMVKLLSSDNYFVRKFVS